MIGDGATVDQSEPKVRYVNVCFMALEPDRDGQYLTWNILLEERQALDMIERVRNGTQLDPLGRPWGPVRCWINKG